MGTRVRLLVGVRFGVPVAAVEDAIRLAQGRGVGLKLISKAAGDERNYVKKAVNWALRQIGKRDEDLRESAIEVSEQLANSQSRAARWIGKDALRELRGKAGG